MVGMGGGGGAAPLLPANGTAKPGMVLCGMSLHVCGVVSLGVCPLSEGQLNVWVLVEMLPNVLVPYKLMNSL